MTPLQQEILARVDSLAVKVGAAGEVLWPALIKKTIIMGWINISIGSICLLLALASAIGFGMSIADKYNDYNADIAISCILIFCLTCAIGFPLMAEGIPRLAAPEVYAFKEILGK